MQTIASNSNGDDCYG